MIKLADFDGLCHFLYYICVLWTRGACSFFVIREKQGSEKRQTSLQVIQHVPEV